VCKDVLAVPRVIVDLVCKGALAVPRVFCLQGCFSCAKDDLVCKSALSVVFCTKGALCVRVIDLVSHVPSFHPDGFITSRNCHRTFNTLPFIQSDSVQLPIVFWL